MTCLPTLNDLFTSHQGYFRLGSERGKYLVYTDQAAVIKAIKEGKTNVDLNAPTTPDNTPGGSTPGGSNTGQTGSDGQGSESSGGTTGKDDTGDGLE